MITGTDVDDFIGGLNLPEYEGGDHDPWRNPWRNGKWRGLAADALGEVMAQSRFPALDTGEFDAFLDAVGREAYNRGLVDGGLHGPYVEHKGVTACFYCDRCDGDLQWVDICSPYNDIDRNSMAVCRLCWVDYKDQDPWRQSDIAF